MSIQFENKSGFASSIPIQTKDTPIFTRIGIEKTEPIMKNFRSTLNVFSSEKLEDQSIQKIQEEIKKLNLLKESLVKILSNFQNSIIETFDIHINHVQTFIKNRVSNPQQQHGRSFKVNKTLNRIQSLNQFHTQISFSLKKNLEVMNTFLTEFDFSHEYPLEKFVNNNAEIIYDSWLFNNINFEKLNLSKLIENENFPGIMKNYIYQNFKNRFKQLTINKPRNHNDKNLEMDLFLVKENSEILESLTFRTIDIHDFKNILCKFETMPFELKNLKKIQFTSSNLMNFEYTPFDNKEFTIFKNLEKIYFVNTLNNLNIFEKVLFKNSRIKVLDFFKCGLINQYIPRLISILTECTNLENLDLASNYFTDFDIQKHQNYSDPVSFKSLKCLNLSFNNLSSIKINNYFPNLNILNLTANNFSSGNEIIHYRNVYCEKCLILNNKNQFIIENKKAQIDYRTYLFKMLKLNDFNVKYLDFSFLLRDFEYEQIELSSSTLLSTKILNMNNCELKVNQLLCFFDVNKFLNLKSLKLKSNCINDEFLRKFLSYQTYKNTDFLQNLQFIDISENDIVEANSFHLIFETLNRKNNLENIKLNFNEIEILFNNYLLVLNSHLGRKGIEEDYDEEMKSFQKFLENVKKINKKNINIIFSKHIKNNVLSYLKKNGLDRTFIFE